MLKIYTPIESTVTETKVKHHTRQYTIKINLPTNLCWLLALYLWTGKALISSSLIEGVEELFSVSSALKDS